MLNYPASKSVPVRKVYIAGILSLLMLVVWVQQGSQVGQLLFLSSNYLTWGLLLAHIYGVVIYLKEIKETPKVILSILLFLIAIILAHFVLSNILFYIILSLASFDIVIPNFDLLLIILPKALLSRAVDLALIAGLLLLMFNSIALNKKNVALLKINSDLQQARLQALKNQLNPHFLFNALHAVSSLIGYDDNKARGMIMKVSSFLRGMLEISEKQDHTLKDELQFIEKYLEIEMERFHDRLVLERYIESECENCIIPTLILQPLIENAFKHGISKVENEAKLVINASLREAELELIIKNSIPKNSVNKENHGDSGIGVKNLKASLEAYYEEKIMLILNEDNSQGYFTVTLKLPFKK